MKMTFIAESGIEVAASSIGEIDYAARTDFYDHVRSELEERWSDGASGGYEEVIEDNESLLEQFELDTDVFCATLRVPYGYLVLTR